MISNLDNWQLELNNNRKNFGSFNTYYQINSYNKAFLRSKGKYILLLDSDDFFKNNKVKVIIDYFKKNSNGNIIFDLPIYYYSSKKQINSKILINKKNINKDIWPRFPMSGSCISFKRTFYKKFSKLINNKNYSMLTLDFRLAVISNTILNDFKLLNKNLTFYFQDRKGESQTKFKKFSKHWWSRRKQAHSFMKIVNKKSKISFTTKSDYLATNLINKIYNFI